MRELKVGDRVRVRSDRGDKWNEDGAMDTYFGTEQVIKEIEGGFVKLENCRFSYLNYEWLFDKEDLTLIEKPMTLEEAIEHSIDKSKSAECEECRKEHKQLYNWLSDYKRLLGNTDKPCNYIAQFMRDNELEIGERFKIEFNPLLHSFNEEYELLDDLEFTQTRRLFRLLVGELELIKLIKLERMDWDTVKGENVEVSDDAKNWYEKKFVLKYQDKFFCENPYDGQLYGWKYARLIKED